MQWSEQRHWAQDLLFARLAGLLFLAGCCLSRRILWFVAPVVPVVVGYGLRDRFCGKFGAAAKIQNIVFE